MTDIVKRLREVNGGSQLYTNTSNSMLLKAADEIEKLTMALYQIQILARIGNTNDKPFIKTALIDCGTIAQSALEGSK